MFNFMHGVKAKLKSKLMDPSLTIECDHDLFRYLFANKGCPSNVPGAFMLHKDDFHNVALPKSWHYTLKKDGDGYCTDFPVRAKAIMKKT